MVLYSLGVKPGRRAANLYEVIVSALQGGGGGGGVNKEEIFSDKILIFVFVKERLFI